MKPKNITRMEREIKLMQSLGDGDSLVQLYGVFESDAHKYLVMEHCRGGDLFKFMLMRGGCLPEGWVCLQVRSEDVQSALAAMHCAEQHGCSAYCVCRQLGNLLVRQSCELPGSPDVCTPC